MAVADDLRRGGGDLLQRLDGGLCLALLVDAQAGVDQHHRQDDHRVRQALARIDGGDGADRRGHDQHDGHGVLQLPQELDEKAVLFAFLQLVGAVLL